MSEEETRAALAAVQTQESDLQFTSFDQNDAWRLGSIAVEIIHERQLALAVEIVLEGHTVFKAALNGVGQGTDEWLAGKAALARHFDSSSLNIRYQKDLDPSVVADIDEQSMKPHGGSFPIRVRGKGTVGTITTSGAKDTVDHEVAVEAVSRAIAG